jgi:predicted RNA-binding Zn-ribbon protein involved in translation (DUF1610 family)
MTTKQDKLTALIDTVRKVVNPEPDLKTIIDNLDELEESLTAYEQEQSQSDIPYCKKCNNVMLWNGLFNHWFCPNCHAQVVITDQKKQSQSDKPERGEETIVSILHYKKQSCHNNIGIFDTRTYVLYDDAVKACDKYSSLKDARIRELEAEINRLKAENERLKNDGDFWFNAVNEILPDEAKELLDSRFPTPPEK